MDSEKVVTEGITKVTAADFVYAKAAGCTIKLLAQSKAVGEDEVLAMVAPFMIGKEHPLAMVNDVFNAVFVTGNMLGDSMYYGKGAGKLPTASAVVADVVDCAKSLGTTLPCFWDKDDVKLADVTETEWKYFVRVSADAEEAVKATFPGGEVIKVAERNKDLGYITVAMKEKDFAAKCVALDDKVLSKIRLA